MRKAAAAVVVLLVGAIVATGYWLSVRGSSHDAAAFFTLPTPAICESGRLAIAVSDAHFSAFDAGRVPDQSGDKFLIVSISVRNDGPSPLPISAQHFYVTERPGQIHHPAARKGSSSNLTGNLPPGETAADEEGFSIPASVGALKLVYDDGCTHQEWLVP